MPTVGQIFRGPPGPLVPLLLRGTGPVASSQEPQLLTAQQTKLEWKLVVGQSLLPQCHHFGGASKGRGTPRDKKSGNRLAARQSGRVQNGLSRPGGRLLPENAHAREMTMNDRRTRGDS